MQVSTAVKSVNVDHKLALATISQGICSLQ